MNSEILPFRKETQNRGRCLVIGNHLRSTKYLIRSVTRIRGKPTYWKTKPEVQPGYAENQNQRRY